MVEMSEKEESLSYPRGIIFVAFYILLFIYIFIFFSFFSLFFCVLFLLFLNATCHKKDGSDSWNRQMSKDDSIHFQHAHIASEACGLSLLNETCWSTLGLYALSFLYWGYLELFSIYFQKINLQKMPRCFKMSWAIDFWLLLVNSSFFFFFTCKKNN